MADATTARSDSASRDATPRLAIPSLMETKMGYGHVQVFYTDGDPYLEQAYALLDILRIGFTGADEIETQKLAGSNAGQLTTLLEARSHTIALALEGVQSLLGIARHLDDVAAVKESNARLDQQEGR